MQENATTTLIFPGLRRRLAAMLYESLLLFAVLVLASFVYVPFFGSPDTPFRKAIFQLFLLAVIAIYFITFWTGKGQTLAMKTWRIRLIDSNGSPLTLQLAVLRFALALAGLACFGISFLWAIVDRDRQFLHDRLCGTRLVMTG